MTKVTVTQRFVDRLRDFARDDDDPSHFQNQIEDAAYSVAAGRAAPSMDHHALRGSYMGYWSFKPFSDNRDFVVLCVPHKRELVLADLGPHSYFFTRGTKIHPPRPDTLKVMKHG